MTKKTLAQVRVSKLWSINRLSEATGLAVTTIVAIEQGAKPRLSTIGKLCKTLECSPDEIAWPGEPLELSTPVSSTYSASFRDCLERLAQQGIYTVEMYDRQCRPEELIIGTDNEAARLQAPTTMEMYVVQNPSPGDIVGKIHLERVSTIVQSALREVVSLEENGVIRYSPQK